MTVDHQLLDCSHGFYNASLDIRECVICFLNANLRQHKILQIIQKPFPTNSLHISGGIHIDGNISKMFI